jgi:hypothetical protein
MLWFQHFKIRTLEPGGWLVGWVVARPGSHCVIHTFLTKTGGFSKKEYFFSLQRTVCFERTNYMFPGFTKCYEETWVTGPYFWFIWFLEDFLNILLWTDFSLEMLDPWEQPCTRGKNCPKAIVREVCCSLKGQGPGHTSLLLNCSQLVLHQHSLQSGNVMCYYMITQCPVD